MRVLQRRQGQLVCAPTEIAFHNSWISAEELKLIAKGYGKSTRASYWITNTTDPHKAVATDQAIRCKFVRNSLNSRALHGALGMVKVAEETYVCGAAMISA